MSVARGLPATHRTGRAGARADFGVGRPGVLVAALPRPPDTTARWLNATYTATHADLVAGIWILKLVLLTLADRAAAALICDRLPDRMNRWATRPRSCGADHPSGAR